MALTKIPSSLLDTSGGFDLQGNITLGDNEQIQLGDSTDLAIYHDGSHSYIKDTGTGNLFIDATSLRLRTGAGTENYLVAEGNGAVTLYHDNSPKIATSSAGATVTGTLTVTGDLDITGDINSYNVTDLDVTDQTITLGAGQTEANSGGSGIIIDGSNASILWDETNDTFDINKGLSVTGQAEFANKLKVYSENNAVMAVDSLSNAYMVIDRSANDRRGALVFSTAAADVFTSPPATGTINWALGVSDSDELSGNKFAIKAGNTNFSDAEFVIDSSGNVGIGDTSPAAKLEIKQGSSNWYEGIRINRSDNATQFGTFSNNSGATFIGAADTAGGNNNAILFGNSTNGTTFTERMRIESDGQIKSVRTNTGNEPYINLELKNTGTAAGLSLDCQYSSGRKYEIQSDTNGQFLIYDRDAGEYRFTIQGDGNVSIGQESGTGKFHVYQATAELTPRFEVGDTSVVGLRLINSSQQWRAGIQSTSSYVIRDVTNSRNTFTLDSSGNATLSGGLTLNGDIDGQNITQLRNHFSSMYVSPTNSNTLNAGYNQTGDDADIWINYRGYQDGTTYFRDFRIGDGKNNGLLHVDASSADFDFFYQNRLGKARFDTNNTVTGQNYLTAGECFPLALRSRSTSATNTVAMTFGHESGDYSNFVGSQKTGSGGSAKAEIVFGGRQANGQSFTEWGRWHDDGNLEMPYQSSFHASSSSNVVTISGGDTQVLSSNFDKVNGTGQHNIGSDYNTSTGIYTAPEDGKYLFTYAIRWEVADYTWSSYHRTYISVNNVNDYEAAHTITGNGQPVANYYNHTGSVVVYLGAGDTVRLKGGQNGSASKIYAGESGWSGTYLG